MSEIMRNKSNGVRTAIMQIKSLETNPLMKKIGNSSAVWRINANNRMIIAVDEGFECLVFLQSTAKPIAYTVHCIRTNATV